VAVCVCEREANTAGRVCFLDAKQLLPKASAAVMRTKASATAMLLFQYENILGRAEWRKKTRYRNGGLGMGKFNLDFRNFIYQKNGSGLVQIVQKFQAKCKSPKEIT
jgi:hypothetical protein